jgi:hypothetical protein
MQRLMMSVLLAASCAGAMAQDSTEPDITAAMLAAISADLDCKKAAKAEALFGCSILAGFAQADAPDPAIVKANAGLNGRRWLGRTVVSDKSSKPTFAFSATTPFEVLIVLGARNSTNFHQKVNFSQGFGYAYIWPTSERQEVMIADAVRSLGNGEVPADSKPAAFASNYAIEFSPPRISSGKSLFIGERIWLRQRGNVLYGIEVGHSKEDTPIYYLSQARADMPLR